MIRHCVLLRFSPETSPGRRAELLDQIDALRHRLPGLLAVHRGPNVSPEHGMDKGYGDGFIADFVDAAARDAYLVDPEHQRIAEQLVAAASGGVEGILVFDLDLDPDDVPPQNG